MKTQTIYAVATDGRDGTQCHIFTDRKKRDAFLVDFWFHEDVKAEAMRIAMSDPDGFYCDALCRMREDEDNRADPMDSYQTDEIEVPAFTLTHPTLPPGVEPEMLAEMLRQGNTVLAANAHPASHTTIESLIAALIAIGKAEITGHFTDGTVPWDVRDFSALHDHVDANTYALLCDERWAWVWQSDTPEHEDANEWRVQARNDVANDVQEGINQWLLDTLELRKAAATRIFTYHPGVAERVGEWESHKDFTRQEWKETVAEGSTQLGYWEWVSHRLND